MRRRPFREHFTTVQPEARFLWRGREVSRLEALADAVFAFAVTLLVVALEVPRTYGALIDVLRSFPSFLAAFSILMVFWHSHYRFFRRYGLQDPTTLILNIAILVMVLFSVYPLKFLFSAWLDHGSSHRAVLTSFGQLEQLYVIYGAGLASIWGLYAGLELHALRLRVALQLTPVEVLLARRTLAEFLICIGICLASAGLALLPVPYAIPGLVYTLIGPALWLNGRIFGRRVQALAAARDPEVAR